MLMQRPSQQWGLYGILLAQNMAVLRLLILSWKSLKSTWTAWTVVKQLTSFSSVALFVLGSSWNVEKRVKFIFLCDLFLLITLFPCRHRQECMSMLQWVKLKPLNFLQRHISQEYEQRAANLLSFTLSHLLLLYWNLYNLSFLLWLYSCASCPFISAGFLLFLNSLHHWFHQELLLNVSRHTSAALSHIILSHSFNTTVTHRIVMLWMLCILQTVYCTICVCLDCATKYVDSIMVEQ